MYKHLYRKSWIYLNAWSCSMTSLFFHYNLLSLKHFRVAKFVLSLCLKIKSSTVFLGWSYKEFQRARWQLFMKHPELQRFPSHRTGSDWDKSASLCSSAHFRLPSGNLYSSVMSIIPSPPTFLVTINCPIRAVSMPSTIWVPFFCTLV